MRPLTLRRQCGPAAPQSSGLPYGLAVTLSLYICLLKLTSANRAPFLTWIFAEGMRQAKSLGLSIRGRTPRTERQLYRSSGERDALAAAEAHYDIPRV